jgi:outer membrane protein TolC
LLARQTDLRLENIAAGRLPVVSLEGLVQYQSDVPIPPVRLPGAEPLFAPPKATYDSFLRIEQRLFDPARGPQSALERAQLGEQHARVRTALFALRQQVNDAFFAAALLQERANAVRAVIVDLEARLKEIDSRVGEGTAIPAESAAVQAALLQRQLDLEELTANRRAALAVLSTLTGRQVNETQTLAIPDLAARVAEARRAPLELRARPEHEQFARTGDRIARQQDVVRAQERPRVNTFARLGYGRPGLNFIQDEFDTYAIAGVQLQWRAWTWGSATREREALRLQQDIVAADQAALAKALTQAIATDEATVDRLQTALDVDARIIALREQVEASARIRLQEAVLTASEYVDRNTELLQARIALVTHRVELAQASARLLTTLGLEVR